MFFLVVSLKYALSANSWSYRHFRKPTDCMLFKQHDKSSPLNCTHCAVSYLQNGDRIVATVSVTSLHTVYSCLATNCHRRRNYVVAENWTRGNREQQTSSPLARTLPAANQWQLRSPRHALVSWRQGRLNQWAHWARAQGPRIFFSFWGIPNWLWWNNFFKLIMIVQTLAVHNLVNLT